MLWIGVVLGGVLWFTGSFASADAADAHYRLAKTLRAEGRYEEALELYRERRWRDALAALDALPTERATDLFGSYAAPVQGFWTPDEAQVRALRADHQGLAVAQRTQHLTVGPAQQLDHGGVRLLIRRRHSTAGRRPRRL